MVMVCRPAAARRSLWWRWRRLSVDRFAPKYVRPSTGGLMSVDFPPTNPTAESAQHSNQILLPLLGLGVASNLDHDHERRRPTKIFPYTSKLATPPVEIASPTQPSSYHDEIKHLQKEAKEISYRPHSR